MSNFNTSLGKKILNYLPVLVLASILVYSFKIHENKSKIDNEFRKEKKNLQNELDQIVIDYKQTRLRKKGLSKRIVTSINKIIALKDSITTIKKENYHKLVQYGMRVNKLQRENRRLLLQADKLTQLNDSIQHLNNEAKIILRAHKKTQDKLSKRNSLLVLKEKELQNKISPAMQVKIGKISLYAYKLRRNGKYSNTNRSDKTSAFKINFDLLENEFASKGKREISIRILDKNNKVILSEKNTSEKTNEVSYNDLIEVNYDNETIRVVSLISVERFPLKEGIFTAVISIGGEIVGTKEIELK